MARISEPLRKILNRTLNKLDSDKIEEHFITSLNNAAKGIIDDFRKEKMTLKEIEDKWTITE